MKECDILGGSKHTHWPLLHIFRGQDPQPPQDLRLYTDRVYWVSHCQRASVSSRTSAEADGLSVTPCWALTYRYDSYHEFSAVSLPVVMTALHISPNRFSPFYFSYFAHIAVTRLAWQQHSAYKTSERWDAMW